MKHVDIEGVAVISTTFDIAIAEKILLDLTLVVFTIFGYQTVTVSKQCAFNKEDGFSENFEKYCKTLF